MVMIVEAEGETTVPLVVFGFAPVLHVVEIEKRIEAKVVLENAGLEPAVVSSEAISYVELWVILALWSDEQIVMQSEIAMMTMSRKGVRTVTVALRPVTLERAPVVLETVAGMGTAMATRTRSPQMKKRTMMKMRRMNVVLIRRTVFPNHGRDAR